MIYFFQTLSLKTRFLGVLLSFLFVLGFWWLLTAAPWALAHLKVLSQGAGLPSFGWGDSPTALQDLLEQWGADGKTLFLTLLAPTLLGFWVASGFFLALAALYLLKKSNPSSPWYLLPLLPLAAAAVGFLEEAALTVAVLLPAQETDIAAWAASLLGTTRGTLFGLSLAAIGLGALGTLARKGLAPKEPPRKHDS